MWERRTGGEQLLDLLVSIKRHWGDSYSYSGWHRDWSVTTTNTSQMTLKSGRNSVLICEFCLLANST